MNYSIVILFILFYCATGLEFYNSNVTRMKEPYCFHFSWLGPTFDDDKLINCSAPEFKTIPCIKPFEISLISPNYTDLWLNRNHSDISCLLRPGYSCIKHTYSFNDAIVNSSHFCGKMIEDTISAVETGCFTQKIGGHVVEACACKSTGFGMPCNSSIRHPYSLVGIILIIIFCIINNFVYP